MANPVLNNTTFRNIAVESDAGRMSIKGTIYKSLALLLMVFAAGAFTWKVVNESIDPSAYTSWMFGGLIVGFILAMVITFKPKAAPYLSPIYAAAEGLVLGSVSAIYNNAFATTAPNIIINAVLLTMLCAFVMLIFYRTGFVKVNGTFMRVLSVALTTILVFYIGSCTAQHRNQRYNYRRSRFQPHYGLLCHRTERKPRCSQIYGVVLRIRFHGNTYMALPGNLKPSG